MTDVTVLQLGLRPYQEVWELQRRLQRELMAGEIPEHLLLCQHQPVITLGTSAETKNVLADEAVLKKNGIDLVKVERGGDVTYHGPGQLVAYPILNLNQRRRDIGWYLRTLEQCAIMSLSDFGIDANTICGKTGVWIGDRKKICSIGVRISRWCTMHGLALNVTPESLRGFDWINPCGFTDIQVTCMQSEGAARPVIMESVESRFLLHFAQAFQFQFQNVNSNKALNSCSR